MECLNKIIGITKQQGDCVPYDWNYESLSGLYLDDTTKGRIPVTQGFWTETQIENLIPDATHEAITRLLVSFEKRLVRKHGQFQTKIGFKDDWTGPLPEANYYYLALKPKGIKGAMMTINGVKIYTVNGLHTGDIYMNGVVADFSKPITLKLDDTIYIAYQGAAPKDFKHTACCNKIVGYKSYLWVGSGTAENLNDIKFLDNDYAQGIELDVIFDCDPLEFLCNVDFKKHTFGVVFAKLVQQIARHNIAYWILSDDKISPYSMVKEDEINVIMAYLSQDIETMLNYLPENLNMSDCYVCNGVYSHDFLI
jgi:hypothetical protein